MLFSLVGILTVLYLVTAPLLADQVRQVPSVNLTNPYWRRTGCYLVGHTRNISIPGCLRFSLSTNACRGYCMSYSIPVNHDIGPPPQPEVEEPPSVNGDGSRKVSSKQHRQRQHQKQLAQSQQKLQQQQQQQEEPELALEQQDQQQRLQQKLQELQTSLVVVDQDGGAERILELGNTVNNGTQLRRAKNKPSSEKVAALSDSLSPSTVSTALKPAANSKMEPHKSRDILSVSRCCSMVETEDRVYNVRCGNNEVRRLVFKSAKSCECFFCKQD